MDKIKSILTFKDYVVKDITFRLNPHYKNYRESAPIKCQIKTNHHVHEENDDLIMVAINVQLFEENFIENKEPFYLNLIIEGFFELKAGDGNPDLVDPDSIEKIVKSNTVAILFPYVRNVVTQITMLANIAPVILPTINTFKLIEEADNLKDESE